MFVNEFIKKAGGDFAETLPPEREDGQPEAKETDSFLVAAIRRTGIPITVTDYETGVESLKVKKYSDDQPRDEKGRFGSGGSAAEHASTKEQHEAAAKYHDRRAAEENSAKKPVSAGGHSLAAQYHREAAAGKRTSREAQVMSSQVHSNDTSGKGSAGF